MTQSALYAVAEWADFTQLTERLNVGHQELDTVESSTTNLRAYLCTGGAGAPASTAVRAGVLVMVDNIEKDLQIADLSDLSCQICRVWC